MSVVFHPKVQGGGIFINRLYHVTVKVLCLLCLIQDTGSC